MRLRRDKRPPAGTPTVIRNTFKGREFILYQDRPGMYGFSVGGDGLIEVNGQALTERDIERGWGLASEYQA